MPNLSGYSPYSVVRLSSFRARQNYLSGPAITPSFKPLLVRNISSGNANSQWQALTWVTQRPHEVTPNDITSTFTHFRTSSGQSSVVPILLVSPEFTTWIEPTNVLLSQWVTPLFHHIHPNDAPDVVHTIAAVVDGVSTLRSNNDSDDKGLSSGTEGLSLLLADSSCVNVTAAPPERMRNTDSDEPSLVLSARAALVSDDRGSAQAPSYHEVGLRLAQTVFRNGRDRTLLGMRWTRDRSSNSYTLDAWRDLSTCSISSARATSCSINAPLHPITKRRRVVSSMGNILRQVSKSSADDSDISMGIPASSELEKELPRYVNELGIPHQRVAVWALVEPSQTASSLDDTSPHDFQELIRNGSKLHRVVSGGGGWGKKQGLLSLDPEIAFEGQRRTSRSASLDEIFQTQTTSSDASEMTDLPEFLGGLGLEENMASLSQVATPGDYIQFFVASDSDASVNLGNQSQTVITAPAKLSYSFGVDAPVETESMNPVTENKTRARPEDVTVIRDHFGAVSESAIYYSHGSPPNSSSEGSNCETKISVPGSRVELVVS